MVVEGEETIESLERDVEVRSLFSLALNVRCSCCFFLLLLLLLRAKLENEPTRALLVRSFFLLSLSFFFA